MGNKIDNLEFIVGELTKYKEANHFFFTQTDTLIKSCNAPARKSGIYVIYALYSGSTELIYIGRSGEIKSDGSLFIRQAGLGGIKDRIVNGKQFGSARRNSWKKQMLLEKIESLKVYWYITHSDDFIDCPRVLENKLLSRYVNIYGELPRWNNEF